MILNLVTTLLCFAGVIYAIPAHDGNSTLQNLEKLNHLEKTAAEFFKGTIPAADLCQDAALDTITRTKDGSTYIFKGNFYWKVNYDKISEPRRIADDWDGLVGNLDASFTRPNGKTYFFKGTRYWIFTNQKMHKNCSDYISVGFKGIPNNLDAALTWSGNGKVYFFKGGSYWRYDFGEIPPVKHYFPLSITEWKGLPLDGIDAAVVWNNNKSYFFKGGHYYLFNDGGSRVANGYPLSTSREWFSCTSEVRKSKETPDCD